MTPARTEWNSQQAIYVYLCKALPHGAHVQSIDEAAKRSREANMRRKARGCLGGVADIMVAWNGVFVFLECKSGSSQRGTQQVFEAAMRRNGAHYALIETMGDAEDACRAAGIPLRASVLEVRERIDAQQTAMRVKRKRSAPRKAGARYVAGKRVAAKLWAKEVT